MNGATSDRDIIRGTAVCELRRGSRRARTDVFGMKERR